MTINGKWSIEKANQWQEKTPWLVGSNFIPSTAINQLEMYLSKEEELALLRQQAEAMTAQMQQLQERIRQLDEDGK